MSLSTFVGGSAVHLTATTVDAAGDPDPNAAIVLSATDASGASATLVATGAGTADFTPDTIGEFDVSATATDPDGNTVSTTVPFHISVVENTDATGISVTGTQ